MARPTRLSWPVLLSVALALGACRDHPVTPGSPPPPGPVGAGPPGVLTPLGVVEITFSNLAGGAPATATATSTGISADLIPPSNADASGNGSIQLERVSAGSFTAGTPGVDGQRYFTATFRVRNAQADGTPYDTPRQNLTLVAIRNERGKAGSPISQLRRFDGSPADSLLARATVPTGATVLDDSLRLTSPYADVLQAFTEAEVAAVTLPDGVLDIFPYGFVVRNATDPASRTLPANPAPGQWDGVLTVGFRLPLQAAAVDDVSTITFAFLALDDTDTRLTQSFEEQDSASHARARARALALGVSGVTVVDGDPWSDWGIASRRLCAVRVAGPAGAPTGTLNAPGPYSRLAQYLPGEAPDPCAPSFRTGTPARPAFAVPYAVTVRAMDRYGNLRPAADDTVTLTTTDGTASAISPPTALAGGEAVLQVRHNAYGDFSNLAQGRRFGTRQPVTVSGSTRAWTGAGGTAWTDEDSWSPAGGAPGNQDTALVAGDLPAYPQFTQDHAIGGVVMTPGSSVQPTIDIAGFDLTLTSSIDHGATGRILGTGRMFFTGASKTIAGANGTANYRHARFEPGTYTLDTNLTVTGGQIVVTGGRLRSTGFRVRVTP